VRSRLDARFIPFVVTEFVALGGHATVFLILLTWQATTCKGMHVGKLLASWRRKVSLAVHAAHTDNVLRGLSAAADDVENASSSVGMSSHATAFFTRAMYGPQASPRFLAPRVGLRFSPPHIVLINVAGEFIVFSYALDSITIWSLLLSWFPGSPPFYFCPRSYSASCNRFLCNVPQFDF
jgi:hypothetical protein